MPRDYSGYRTRLHVPELALDEDYLPRMRRRSTDGSIPMLARYSILDQLEDYHDHGKISRDKERRRRVFRRQLNNRLMTVMIRDVELPPLPEDEA